MLSRAKAVMTSAGRTYLAFQHDAKLHKLPTKVTAVHAFTSLEEANRGLFKQGTDQDHVVVTEKTIFHPQGGGQPSDVGTMTGPSGVTFDVQAVRMDTVRDGQVLHLGRFTGSGGSSSSPFKPDDTVEQSIDADKRLLYSRLHTAGHVLGAAVRHLLEKEVEGFDELKASHFPDSAACEFAGLIEAKWKDPVQKKVDEYVAAAMPVEIDWWDEEDFRAHGLERLIPDRSLTAPGEKFRVVNIVGAEVYPCGGTHVDTTDLCGPTKVKKISRSKGQSRVSYTVV
jgi:Ser-tRNA(Ala) deacylase AlaX